MKELIRKDEYGVFADTKDTVRVDSLYVAEFFDKRHDNIIRDIDRMTSEESGLSKDFILLNFEEIKYTDGKGRKQRAYAMTRDGFTMLVMGYTGKKAMKFKELYIEQFNRMEQTLNELVKARNMFPELTDAILEKYEAPKGYIFSNECNMINKIVTGKTAKEIREENGLKSGESIRPLLSDEELEMINTLQHMDSTLLFMDVEYPERKSRLKAKCNKVRNKNKAVSA